MSLVDLILAGALLVLFVVILGTRREMVILHRHVTALSQLITKPPAPSFLGDQLPAVIAQELASCLNVDRSSRRAHILIFLRAHCFGCDELMAQLARAIAEGDVARDGISCIVSAASEDSPIFEKAQMVCRTAVLDPKDTLFKASEVKGTPSQLAVWTDSLEVFDYTIGGDVEWIWHRLRQQPSQNPALMRS